VPRTAEHPPGPQSLPTASFRTEASLHREWQRHAGRPGEARSLPGTLPAARAPARSPPSPRAGKAKGLARALDRSRPGEPVRRLQVARGAGEIPLTRDPALRL